MALIDPIQHQAHKILGEDESCSYCNGQHKVELLTAELRAFEEELAYARARCEQIKEWRDETLDELAEARSDA